MNVSAQILHGRVIDSTSGIGVANSEIILKSEIVFYKTKTDSLGFFKFANLKKKNYSLKISKLGYKKKYDNIFIIEDSVFVQIFIQDTLLTTQEVKVSGKRPALLNESFGEYTVEMKLAEKMPANFDDPNRTINNSAATITVNDFYNSIIIRGNSPTNTIYKVEGIEIPNPNHFATKEGLNGSISMLHNNALNAINLKTLNFDATHGNAIAGVFSYQLKKEIASPNATKIQAGVLGINAQSEGTLAKFSKSTYLARYRYSTLGILSAFGLNYKNAPLPTYQDAQVTLNLSNSTLKNLKIWFIGGKNTLIEDKGNIVTTDNLLGILGTTFNYDVTTKTNLEFGIMGSLSKNNVLDEYKVLQLIDKTDYSRNILRGQAVFKTHISNKFLCKYGVTLSNQRIEYMSDSIYNESNIKQYFITGIYTPNKYMTIEAGSHALYSSSIAKISNRNTIYEPRFKFDLFLPQHWSLNLSLGHFSQIENPIIYINNTDLSFSRSYNSSIGINKKLGNDINFKVELYYQYLYGIPTCITQGFEGVSFINSPSFSNNLTFNRHGKGINKGIEFLFEKSLSNNWFANISGSVFDSKYLVNDSVWLSTRYDLGYAGNFILGKSFNFSKNRELDFGIKLNTSGGQYLPEIDYNSSQNTHSTKYINGFYLTQKASSYSKIDLQISYNKQYPKMKVEWKLDIMNLLNKKNMLAQYYNTTTNSIQNQYMLGIIPSLSCRLSF